MSRHARHRASLGERATAATLAPVLLVILSAVCVVLGASSVHAESAGLSRPAAHVTAPAARGQEWPTVSPLASLPPVTIDAIRASR